MNKRTVFYAEVLGGDCQQVNIQNHLLKTKLPERKWVDGRYVPQYEFKLADGRTAYIDCHLVDKREFKQKQTHRLKNGFSRMFS